MKGPNPRHEPETASAEGLIADPESLRPGDRVVYPNQGVCRVASVEVKEIAGQKLEMVRMEREEDGATVLVPKGKFTSIGLRRVATRAYAEGVFHYLAAQYDDPELDWKIRHRDNADRLITGGVLGVAEVVKGLHALSHIRPLPTKEREQYDNARHLLVAEIAAALAVPPGVAEDYVDFALMPPAGTKFHLKPPPTPVTLPVRMRRKPLAKSEDDVDLDDLGLDLGDGLAEAPEGAEGPEGGAEGSSDDEEGAAVEGQPATAAAGMADSEEDAEAGSAAPGKRARQPAAKAGKAAAKEKAGKPAKKEKAVAKEKPAKPAAKAAKPAPKKKAAKGSKK